VDEGPLVKSPAADLLTLKAGGFIKQRQRDIFTVRVRAPMGTLTAVQMKAVAEAAELFGDGRLHLSVRQSPEIIGVAHDRFDELVDYLAQVGLSPASCGPRVRAVTGCSGCAINPLALIDTQALGAPVDKAFFGQAAHGKFKITFSGCLNDCTRAKCADLGFVGMIAPGFDQRSCSACGLCALACRTSALSASSDGIPDRASSRCVGCGDCVRVCPGSAMHAEKVGLAVYAGGKHGRVPRIADHVATMLPSELVGDVISATLDWYRRHGSRGLRLGHIIEQRGVEEYKRTAIQGPFRVPVGAQRQTGRIVR
jgi:anaerobic sulfite reductase subunit C